MNERVRGKTIHTYLLYRRFTFTSRVVCGFGNSKMSASLWASKSKKRRSQITTLLITNRRTSPPNHKLPCSVYSYCRCVQSEMQKIRIFQIGQLDGVFKSYVYSQCLA